MKTSLACLLMTAAASAQSSWYVDVHGTAPGAGTATDPYTSIQFAIDQPTTLTNDTILVRPGVYDEHVAISKKVHLISTAGPTSTVITTSTAPATLMFQFPGGVGGVIEGLTLQKTGGPGAGARVVSGDELKFSRCIVIGNGTSDGVWLTDGAIIDHCLITNCAIGVKAFTHASGSITNSILWGSYTDIAGPDFYFEYCDYGYGAFGPSGVSATNITLPPLVRSLTGHDFHLRSTSPCIDAGDPAAPHDPDGSRSDIGPLPYDASYVPVEVYCTAKPNSLGCVPQIGAVGNASASAPVTFDIVCANELNNRPGLLFYGFTASNVHYQGGYFCIQPPVRRTPLLDSAGNSGVDDCSGLYNFEFNAVIRAGSDAALAPGVEVFAQYWSRDSAASFTTNRSDAVRFTIAP